jgi:hypothetical protein
MKDETLKKKIQRVRKKLRLVGILPDYGAELTEEQQLIWDQLKKGDFSYWVEYSKSHFNTFKYKVPDPSNQRQHIRKRLRQEGYLPPYGEPLTEEQQNLLDEIKRNDFTFYNEHVKEYKVTTAFVCKICGDDDLINFYVSQKSKCKSCISREMKKKYIDGAFPNRYGSNLNWVLDNFIRHKVQQAKYRAIKKGIGFNLTDEIVENIYEKQGGMCYYTGVKLTFNTHDWSSLSIDRIDNDLGYTEDNIVLTTRFVNSSKNIQTTEEFIDNIKQCYIGLSNNGHFR